MASLDLIPRNEEALRIVTDPVNGPFLRLTGAGDVVISLPLDNISKTKGNLVTFGRDPSVCDVYLGSSKYYAKTHCFIYVHPVSGEFVLQDVSSSQSVGLGVESGDDRRFHLQGAPRRRVLATSRCTIFGIRQAAFQLSWCGRQSDVQQAKMRHVAQRDHLTRTSVERESVLPPQPGTRVQPPAAHGVQLLRKIDHQPRGDLGSGSYGKVKLTVDLDSGDLLAVKQFPIRPELEKQQKEKVKHEVLLLSKLSHVSSPDCAKMLILTVPPAKHRGLCSFSRLGRW
jgi:FHA domain